MKININIKKAGLACCMSFALTSCSDFLDILPLNDVVLENYWTEKADVQSAVTGCYTALEKSDCITRMACWGEMRSDNIIAGSAVPDPENQILKGNLLSSSDFTKWTCFYQVINRCNTVLYYAPQVQKKDPNFTDSELKATIAEVTALRDLCYFYLIRTFRDVPFVVTPSIDDNQNYQIPVSSFDSILKSLIADLEAVKDDAVKKYAIETHNTGRITRYSIYAMLADMYLWKQDYDNCISYCDLLIDYKTSEYNSKKNSTISNSSLKLYGSYPLISEQYGTTTLGRAYYEIFGMKNSFESIFELGFVSSQKVENKFVADYYGTSDKSGNLAAPDFLCMNVAAGGNSVFKNTDCRYLESMLLTSSLYTIQKYVYSDVTIDISTPAYLLKPLFGASLRSTKYANWILYRITDIMLIKAEAEVQKAGLVDANNVSANQDSCYHTAFSLVSAVYNRANNMTSLSRDTLVYNTYASSKIKMEDLVLLERQRELLFEGKRWYDLVRLARREGNNTRLISHVLNKYTDNLSAIRNKLTSPFSLYFPFSKDELKINPFLVQNPAYNNESSSSISE